LKRKNRWLIATFIAFVNISIGIANAASAPSGLPLADIYGPTEAAMMVAQRPEKDRHEAIKERHEEVKNNPYSGIVFKHGDISWLPLLASQAGWPEDTHAKLAKIVLRESGGCPNRKGGDVVDENCQFLRVSEWNHRSDTGLLQINGVNYNTKRNKWARVCLDLGICQQELLLDPLTNLKAGYLLYTYSGWGPWDPCTWGEEWAHRCKKDD